jgi:hypothetical protein
MPLNQKKRGIVECSSRAPPANGRYLLFLAAGEPPQMAVVLRRDAHAMEAFLGVVINKKKWFSRHPRYSLELQN